MATTLVKGQLCSCTRSLYRGSGRIAIIVVKDQVYCRTQPLADVDRYENGFLVRSKRILMCGWANRTCPGICEIRYFCLWVLYVARMEKQKPKKYFFLK